jgi:hypothetical protein
MISRLERIENKLLSFSRVIFFILSLVAFIGFIIVSVKLFMNYSYTADTEIHINMENITDRYKQYKKEHKDEPKKEKNETNTTESEFDGKIPIEKPIEKVEPTTQEKFDVLIRRIIDNINAYIHIVDGGEGKKVNEDKIYTLLADKINEMTDINGGDIKIPFKILDGLDSSIKYYVDRANDISKLDKGDIDRVDMRKYVVWYLGEYKEILLSEKRRVNSELNELRNIKSAQMMTLYVWGSLLSTFIIFTLFLVIYKIEKNTRTDNE